MFRNINKATIVENAASNKHPHAARRDPADCAGMGLVSFNDRSDDTAFDHLFKGDDVAAKHGRPASNHS
jgi:hypothetical protein